jgi:hypothetical protein
MSPSSDLTFPFLKNLDISPAWKEAARRVLKTAGATMALGLILPCPWQDGILQVLTPLPASRLVEVRGLSRGRLKLSPNGREFTAGAPQT